MVLVPGLMRLSAEKFLEMRTSKKKQAYSQVPKIFQVESHNVIHRTGKEARALVRVLYSKQILIEHLFAFRNKQR